MYLESEGSRDFLPVQLWRNNEKCGFFNLNARGGAESIGIKESTFSSHFSVLNHCRIRKYISDHDYT